MRLLFCTTDGENAFNGINAWLLDFLPSLAAAGHEPALDFATSSSLAQAVVKDNPALPVVFLSSVDPVAAGLVDTHAVPGRSACSPPGRPSTTA